VALCGRAVLLLGESGAGKSTCAAFLCASADAELLADDVAEIDLVAGGPLVRPVEADNWLFGDSAAVVGASAPEDVKAPVVAPRAAQAAVPLGAVVVLEFDDAAPAPRVEPIRGQAAFAAVNAAYVRFAIDDVEVHLRDLDAIARIVAASAVVRLSRPRSLDALADTAALLCELASRVSAAACQEGT
jgi:hypothetical protein